MKIAITANNLLYETRAIRRYVLNLIRNLPSIDATNEYIAFCFGVGRSLYTLPSLPTSSQVTFKHKKISARLLRKTWNLLSWPKLESLIRTEIDIVHAAEHFFYPPQKRGKSVFTIHGLVSLIIPQFFSAKFRMATECAFQRAARHFDHFIAVSANVAQEFMDTMKVAEDRVTTIPLGISEEFRVIEDRQASKNAIRERFDIANPYLLYVGALSSHKNVAALIDAYGILIESGRIEHSLVLVGPSDAAYYEELRRKIMDIKLADHVRFLGTVMQDSDDLPLLYNGADLFVFPTLYEAWTSPPLEAMACGTPVVTSNISSLPETVGNAALLFNPHDVEDIAHAIDQGLNDDSLRQSLIARGLERASRFTWQRMTNDTLKVYKKLA